MPVKSLETELLGKVLDDKLLAEVVLESAGSLKQLRQWGFKRLEELTGSTETARQINAAFLLADYIYTPDDLERDTFTSSQDLYDFFRGRLFMLQQEEFIVVGLNNRNEYIFEKTISVGTSNECHVDPKDVLRPLLYEAASRSVLVHNHPSGDPTPSPFDVALTKRLKSALELVGITVLDHIIVGRAGYCSMRDLGLLRSE